ALEEGDVLGGGLRERQQIAQCLKQRPYQDRGLECQAFVALVRDQDEDAPVRVGSTDQEAIGEGPKAPWLERAIVDPPAYLFLEILDGSPERLAEEREGYLR